LSLPSQKNNALTIYRITGGGDMVVSLDNLLGISGDRQILTEPKYNTDDCKMNTDAACYAVSRS
jgi:hypothetical protein